MNTSELECLLTKVLIGTNTVSLGVRAADQLPDVWPVESVCIVNTDNADKPGEHWVVYYHSQSALEFFDSYGLPPSAYPNLTILNVLYYNPISLQSIGSSVCGHYCIFYVYFRARTNHSRNVINKILSLCAGLSPRERDRIVRDFVQYSLKRIRCPTGAQCCVARK